MVNYGILAAALSFPALELEVEVSVTVRDVLGRTDLVASTDEVKVAKIETVKAVAELMHYEYFRELLAEARRVDHVAKHALAGATPTILRNDQLSFDLFNEAIEAGEVEAAYLFKS